MKDLKVVIRRIALSILPLILSGILADSSMADMVVEQKTAEEIVCSIWLDKLNIEAKDTKNNGIIEERLVVSIEEGSLDFSQVSKPALPYVEYRLLLPQGFTVSGVDTELDNTEEIKLLGKLDFIPPPITTEDYADPKKRALWEDSFAEDAEIYSKDAYYLPEVTVYKQGLYLGYQLLTLRVNPFQYHPIKGELRYSHHVVCRIHLSPSDPLASTEPSMIIRNTQHDQDTVKKLIVNKEDISNYQPLNTNSGSYKLDPALHYYYVIVTVPEFAAACEPIRQLRSYDSEHQATIITLNDIPAVIPGHPTYLEIKDYFQNKLYPAPPLGAGTEFILLVGDAEFIPTCRMFPSDPLQDSMGDTEFTNFFSTGPQIAIGRISANDIAQISNYYNKISSGGSLGLMIPDGADRAAIYRSGSVFVSTGALRALWEPYVTTDLVDEPNQEDTLNCINTHSFGSNTGHGIGPAVLLPVSLNNPNTITTLNPFYYGFGCKSAAFWYGNEIGTEEFIAEQNINHRYTYSGIVGATQDMYTTGAPNCALKFFNAYFHHGYTTIGEMLSYMVHRAQEDDMTLLGDPFIKIASSQILNMPRIAVSGESSYFRSYSLGGNGQVDEVSIPIYAFNNSQWEIANLTYSDSSLASHITISPMTGSADATVRINVVDVNSLVANDYTVEFDIKDVTAGGSLVVRHIIYNLHIQRFNRPPVLDPIGDKTVTVGQLLTFAVTASDPDGDQLEFYCNMRPLGAIFDSSTGTFSWTPNVISNNLVMFGVYDGIDFDYELVHITAIGYPYTYNFLSNWNLISLPINVPNASKNLLFPTSTSNAFTFNPSSGYVSENTLQVGKGYWLKFPSAQSITIVGMPQVANLTIPVHAGWNIIGSISAPVNVTAITSNPQDIVVSEYFSFENGQHQIANTIEPGKGYWVKISREGTLTLSASAPPSTTIRPNLSGLNKIIIKDNTNKSQSLYYGIPINTIPSDKVTLPPKFSGNFDVRFQSGKYVETFASVPTAVSQYTIAVDSLSYPFMLSWQVSQNNYASSISYVSQGSTKTVALVGTGSLTIIDPTVKNLTLKVSPSSANQKSSLR